jgi:hypothetical protein
MTPDARRDEDDDASRHSGRISASVGKELHGELTSWATSDGLSLSQLVLKLLSRDAALRRSDRPDDLQPTLARVLLSAGPADDDLRRIDEDFASRPVLALTMKALSIIAGARRPEDPEASRRVGRLAMQARKDHDRLVALPLFEASVRLDSGNTRSRSVLGQLHHDVGNWPAGMRELQQVVDRDARDNHALLHLGWCRLQLGTEEGDENATKLAVEELATALRTWANDVRTLKTWSQWRHQVDRLGEFTSDPGARSLYGELDQLSDRIRPRN